MAYDSDEVKAVSYVVSEDGVVTKLVVTRLDDSLLEVDIPLPETLETGSTELAYAENISGTATPIGTAATDIPGLVVSIPQSNGRPVWLEATVTFDQTVDGSGVVFAMFYETTSGSPVQLAGAVEVLPGLASGWVTVTTKLRLGAVSSTRTFKLVALITRAAGSSAAIETENTVPFPTYLTAYVR